MSSMPKPYVRIRDDFLRDLHADYRANGAAAIASLRREEPRSYFELVRSYLYHEVPAPASPSGDTESGEVTGE